MSVNKVPPETFYVLPTAHSPNSRLPVVVYRNALNNPSFESICAAMQTKDWVEGGHWTIAKVDAAAVPHFHSNAHECYGVIRGTGHYLLGKSPIDPDVDSNGQPVGVKFTANAGDVFIYPAGVTHFVTQTEGEYEIVGLYSRSEFNSDEHPWDSNDADKSVEGTNEDRKRCERVPIPERDPLYGREGPLLDLWKAVTASWS